MKKRLEKAFYWVCWKLVWIFYPKTTVEGTENLPEEPSIVVGNHSQANGPILAELYFPGKRAIWCAGQMMSAKEIPDYAYHDFWDEKPKALKPLFRLLSYIIAPFASCVMRCGDTIAVYHDTRVINTFRDTVKSLQAGNHIIIFPECKKGYNQILCAFQENFVDVRVGEEMYQRRGGMKYFKSEAKLQKYMWKHGLIGFPKYVYNTAIRFAVQVAMPNWLRGGGFQKFARS